MLKKLLITSGIFLSLFAGAIALTQTASAQESQARDASRIAGPKGLLSGVSQACYDQGDCSLCDVVAVINTVIKFVLGIVGSVALAAFVWAGFNIMFMKSQISYFSKAKDTIKYAIIGLFLVFFSYILVNFGLNILVSANVSGSVNYGGMANIFGTGWASICAQQ